MWMSGFQNPLAHNHYQPQTKLREGNVFRSVCDIVHRWSLSRGGLCLGGLCPGRSLYSGVSVRETPPHPYRKEQAVCILLECFLVSA